MFFTFSLRQQGDFWSWGAAKVHHGRQLFPWASASTQIATSPTPLGLTDKKAAVVVRSIQRIKSKHISVCFSQLVAKLQTCTYHKIMQHDPMKCLLENCGSRGPLNAEASSLVRAIVENWTSRQDRTYCNIKVSQTFCSVVGQDLSSQRVVEVQCTCTLSGRFLTEGTSQVRDLQHVGSIDFQCVNKHVCCLWTDQPYPYMWQACGLTYPCSYR